MAEVVGKNDGWTEISVEDARTYYADWFFEIKQAHWPAVGIQRLTFMNAEKTEVVRKSWEERNPRYWELHPTFFGKIKAVKHLPEFKEWRKLAADRLLVTYTYPAFGLSNPLVYGFHLGDVFRAQDGSLLQVVAEGRSLEVKFSKGGESIGYAIDHEQLSDWLRTGDNPAAEFSIHKNQSRSDIAKFYEYTQ